MRQMVALVTCDDCNVSMHPEVPETRLTITMPGALTVSYVADLCEGCASKLNKALHDVTQSVMRLPTMPANGETYTVEMAQRRRAEIESEENRTCPMCQTVGATRQALGYHLKIKHNTSLTALGLAFTPGGKRIPAATRRADA